MYITAPNVTFLTKEKRSSEFRKNKKEHMIMDDSTHFEIKTQSISGLKYLNDTWAHIITINKYDAKVAIAAPTIPKEGISRMFNVTFREAANI